MASSSSPTRWLDVPVHWPEPAFRFTVERLPELPTIPDAVLARQAFVHRSAPCLRAETTTPPTTPYERDLKSYEPLEGLGDCLLGYAVYRCIRATFKDATATILGDMTKRLTTNRTFSFLSVAYDLPTKLDFGGTDDLRQNQKVAADLFEAYVGALGECEEVSPGSTRLWSWLRALFSPVVWPDLGPTIYRLAGVIRAKRDPNGTEGAVAHSRWSCPDCNGAETAIPPLKVTFDSHDQRKGWHASLWLEDQKVSCGTAQNKRDAEVVARNRAIWRQGT